MSQRYRFFWLLLVGCLSLAGLQAQPAHVPGELIVMFDPGQGPALLPTLSPRRLLSARLRIWLMDLPPQADEAATLRQVQAQPGVTLAQYNHYIQPRQALQTFPNDPDFGDQWDMHNTGQNGGLPDADIDAPEAWDLTTGGLTAAGDTIVVAVIDGGIDLGHPDLNLWKNHAEIPGNGLDDDNNGYIDDYDGWDAYDSDGSLPGDSHGTHVSGTVSARGDNGLGVTGVNWHAQVMPIAGSSGQEATVVEAYGYALEMRARYNQSQGAEGAFVVATNSSFGVDFGQPVDFPIWCAMYDSLGAVGILSAAATMNNGSDVDQTGDIPTACASPYMISVTNTTRLDQRNNGAAFGLTTIDLGAPGTQIPSTLPNGNYGNLTGTSMATPHVAGAIALLLSYPCPGLAQQYQVDPAGTALLIRDYLFAGTDSIPALTGSTVTGGRLNLYQSLLLVENACPGFATCAGVTGLSGSSSTDTTALLSWNPVDSALAYHLQYRPQGDSLWIDAGLSSGPPFALSGLTGCTPYEFQVESLCDSSTASGFFLSGSFTTEGCCEAPNWEAVSLAPDSTQLSWAPVYGATAYSLRYRPLGDSIWITTTVTSPQLTLSGLEPCRGYVVQVATSCPKGPETDYSPLDTVYTTGCGACLDAPYCASSGSNAQFAWIESIALGPLHNPSGNDGGYGAYSLEGTPFYTDSLYQLVVVPGSSNPSLLVTWRAWIDYSRDGDFDDPGELILQTPPQAVDTVTVPLLIPATAGTGGTRLRIAVKYGNQGGSVLPPACGDIGLGEVEDYCLLLREERPCLAPTALEAAFRTADSDQVDVRWASAPGYQTYTLRYRPLGEPAWTTLTVDTNYVALPPLASCTVYEIAVQGSCATDSGSFSAPITLRSRGCGPCLDLSYCPSGGQDVQYEWIRSVGLDSLVFASGSDGGYADRTGQPVALRRGDSLTIQLRPGFGAAAPAQRWAVFVDWDQNGDFTGSGETVFQSASADTAGLSFRVVVPATASLGISRLRVAMRRGLLPAACGTFTAGETEDYCLDVLAGVSLTPQNDLPGLHLFPNPAQDQLRVAATEPLRAVTVYSLTGQPVYRWRGQATQLDLSVGAWPRGLYLIQVQGTQGMAWRKVQVE